MRLNLNLTNLEKSRFGKIQPHTTKNKTRKTFDVGREECNETNGKVDAGFSNTTEQCNLETSQAEPSPVPTPCIW